MPNSYRKINFEIDYSIQTALVNSNPHWFDLLFFISALPQSKPKMRQIYTSF